MKKLYNGSISIWDNANIDMEDIETLLGFSENQIIDIWFNVEFYVYGKYIPATFYDPAEYPELDDVKIVNIRIEVVGGMETAGKDQFDLLESYLPDDNELLWNIVEKTNIYG
jgi:hypothetical protein